MNLENLKVLIVDDIQSSRKTISVLLREIGIKNVSEAQSSKEALLKMKENSFNLIISDWEMPDLNGLELLSRAKSIKNYKNVPFLMVTSTSEKQRVIEALKAGVTDYAIKPISVAVLSDKINRIFNRDSSLVSDSR